MRYPCRTTGHDYTTVETIRRERRFMEEMMLDSLWDLLCAVARNDHEAAEGLQRTFLSLYARRLWLTSPDLSHWEEFVERHMPEEAELIRERMRFLEGSAHRRSRRLIAELLGEEALGRLEEEGCLIVRSKNGKRYMVNDRGSVFCVGDGGRVCVSLGASRIPDYDRVLTLYITLRDRPELVLGRRG